MLVAKREGRKISANSGILIKQLINPACHDGEIAANGPSGSPMPFFSLTDPSCPVPTMLLTLRLLCKCPLRRSLHPHRLRCHLRRRRPQRRPPRGLPRIRIRPCRRPIRRRTLGPRRFRSERWVRQTPLETQCWEKMTS